MRFQRSLILLGVLTLPAVVLAAPQTPQAPVIGGERFVKHPIYDTEQGNIPAINFHVPVSWRVNDKIEWHYGWTENPIEVSIRAENPANAEAYFLFPLLRCDSMDVAPNLRQYVKNPAKQGERLGMGAINLSPRPPLQALEMIVRQIRGQQPNFHWIGQQSFPNLAHDLSLDPWPGDTGIAIKIGYTLNNQPVEEAFYAIYYLSKSKNMGGQAGAVYQTSWGLRQVQSFRAPAGTLGKRMTVFAAIAKSVLPTPQWIERANAVNAQLTAAFNRKLQQGNDQLRAAQEIDRETRQNLAAFDKTVDAQIQANRASGSYSAPAAQSSPWDGADKNIREEDTTIDPGSPTGTSQHSYMQKYHWTNGFGDYRDSNDPNYNPNSSENGNWQLMTTVE
jgi:hypothetical protein